MQALHGIRVLDLTRLLPGAMATQYLADAGAGVVKIEQPGAGDYARHLFTAHDENPVFTATNRGKRSIAIDLKHPRGRDALESLARHADVLIESFRPGVMDRFGIGYQQLRHVNPRLIYAALTGYGQTGEMRDAAGHDLNYLAMAGALDLIGEAGGPPMVPNFQMADLAGGAMQSAMSIAMALFARERSGVGECLDISMTEGAAAMLTVAFASHSASGHSPSRGEGILSGAYACYTVYRCRDNRFVAVGALEPKFWAALCRGLGRDDLIERQYADEARQAALKSEVAAIFSRASAAHWVERLTPYDCCVTLVRTISEAAGGYWRADDRPAPQLGRHTREVLLEAGMSEPEIEESLQLGAIA